MWAVADEEGLVKDDGLAEEDVLVSAAFDRLLTLARESGLKGKVQPVYHNYVTDIETIG